MTKLAHHAATDDQGHTQARSEEPSLEAALTRDTGPAAKPRPVGGTPQAAGAEANNRGPTDTEAQVPVEREVAPVPRIVLHAFCETSDAAVTVERAAADRLMARAKVEVRPGGVAAAVERYRQERSPNLILIESRAGPDDLPLGLDDLSKVCDLGTKVLVIGYSNDIGLFRTVLERGVSEYLVGPVDAGSLIAAVSSIYRGETTAKLGKVYAFVGAKGGAGSSTVAHNVAWSIAQSIGSDVLLADLDLPFGTASLNFDLDPAQGIADAIEDPERLDATLLERLLASCQDHLSLLAAPGRLDRSYDHEEGTFLPLLEVAQAQVPHLVLDIPHLWTAWSKTILASADRIVITAEPDLANLKSAKGMVAHLKDARPNDSPPKLVLNRTGVPKRPEIKPQDFAAALGIELIAVLPFEPQPFGTAANNGQMIAQAFPKTVAARKLAEVAEIVTGRKETKRRKDVLGAISGLFGRSARPLAAGKGK